MIENEKQLAVVREQIALVEGALESFRRDFLPKGRSRFELFSEAYIDQIAELQRDIDEYLARRPTVSPPAGRPETSRDATPRS